MKIAIIGGGYTGIAAAYYLSKKSGLDITIIEKDNSLGGLASGFKSKNWQWNLEKYYHHIFTSDKSFLDLAKEINYPLSFIKPKTSIYYQGKIFPFDSALSLLKFPHISFISRLRTGSTVFFLKLINNWRALENISAQEFIQKSSGDESWKVIWGPLLKAKFGKSAEKIPCSWFWSRIKKRSKVFGYPKGGFDAFTSALIKKLRKRKVKILLNSEVKTIKIKSEKFKLVINTKNTIDFDKVICTLPSFFLISLISNLPLSYAKKLKIPKARGVVNLILSLKKRFLTDGTYWLNINDKKFPFIGVVEHTNFIPPKRYGGDHLIHIVNYLPPDHPYFKKDEQSLTRRFYPFLKKINPQFEKNWIKDSWVFKTRFAQPIVELNYSKKILPFKTPVKNLYLANMQQIYPWDRQTNYAIELGKKISEIIIKAS